MPWEETRVRFRTRDAALPLEAVEADLASARRGRPSPPGPVDLFDQADALFGDMPDGVLIQKDGRIVYANARLVEMLGLESAASLVGTVALELYPESAFESVITRLQSAYFGRPTPARRHPICTPGGEPAEVDVSCLLLQLAGSPMLIEILRAV
jgi:PAS domain-containing protein